MLAIIRPLRAIVKGLCANNSTRQLAFGVAIGMVIGLVPKGNLIALSLVVLLCSIKVNRGAGLVAAFVFSWVGMLLDPLSHIVGWAILSDELLRPVFVWLMNLPIIPWTCFNNTVVLGSFVIGGCLFYPVFRASHYAIENYAPVAIAILSRQKIYQFFFGTELATRWKVQ